MRCVCIFYTEIGFKTAIQVLKHGSIEFYIVAAISQIKKCNSTTTLIIAVLHSTHDTIIVFSVKKHLKN